MWFPLLFLLYVMQKNHTIWWKVQVILEVADSPSFHDNFLELCFCIHQWWFNCNELFSARISSAHCISVWSLLLRRPLSAKNIEPIDLWCLNLSFVLALFNSHSVITGSVTILKKIGEILILPFWLVIRLLRVHTDSWLPLYAFLIFISTCTVFI